MRMRLSFVLLALLLAPAALAQETHTFTSDEAFQLRIDDYRVIPLEALQGDAYRVQVTADHPVDAVLIAGNVDNFYAPGGSYRLRLVGLNATAHDANGTFESVGPWSLVIDNTNRTLANGADGSQPANVTVHLVLQRTVVPLEAPTSPEGSRNPWPVLMLTAPHWDLAIVGLGGMALWYLILAAAASVHYREGWAKVGVLAVGVGLLLGVWLLLPQPGPISQIGFPILVAAGIIWLAYRGANDVRQQVRLAFLGAGLGALLATALAHLVSLAWSEPGLLVLGGDRFADPVFVVPVAAFVGVLLLALIVAFVNAFDDEDAPAPTESPGLSASFTVQCIRCATSIKVDRSMRRFRIATDRYEFACPNCQTWMEWAEPKPAQS